VRYEEANPSLRTWRRMPGTKEVLGPRQVWSTSRMGDTLEWNWAAVGRCWGQLELQAEGRCGGALGNSRARETKAGGGI
jgi:hypothetical protein